MSHLLIRTFAADGGAYVVDHAIYARITVYDGQRSSAAATLTTPLWLLVGRQRSGEWLNTGQVVAAFVRARVVDERSTAEQRRQLARLVCTSDHITLTTPARH